MQGALNDRVGLGVHRPLAVVVHDHAAGLAAVRDPARRAVVAGREDAVLAREHAAHAARGQVARVATVRAI